MRSEKTCVAVLALAVLLSAPCLASEGPATPTPVPCSGPEWKQLDFWLGDWDASWPDSPGTPAGHGTNSIRKILNGCVVEETFTAAGPGGLLGRSLSTYDPRLKRWRQTWVDSQGSYLDFTGGPENGPMTLTMERTRPDGVKVLSRMVFLNVTADAFDWRWERSTDGGATWTLQWPIHYARRKGTAPPR